MNYFLVTRVYLRKDVAGFRFGLHSLLDSPLRKTSAELQRFSFEADLSDEDGAVFSDAEEDEDAAAFLAREVNTYFTRE